MISGDTPVGALFTDPIYRHLFGGTAIIYAPNQLLTRRPRVVHNHPSGDPNPSRADIEMTKTIIDTGRPLGVVVHDHIIVGRNGHASLKGMQLI